MWNVIVGGSLSEPPIVETARVFAVGSSSLIINTVVQFYQLYSRDMPCVRQL